MRPMGALRSVALAACCLLSGWPGGAAAALDAGGSLGLTQDDVYRGISETCGHPAAQADLHARERGTDYWAAFLGAWASAGLGSYPCAAAKELNVYAGYSLAVTTNLSATFTYTRYAFPGGGYYNAELYGQRYDYDQLEMSWSFADRLYLTFAWTPDAVRYRPYGEPLQAMQDRSAIAYGVEWHQPLASWLAFTATAGYDRMADPFGKGYAFWSAGLSHSAGPFELDVGYFRAAERAVRLFGRDVAGGRVSATVLWRF